MNFERLSRNQELLQGHKGVSARFQAQAFLLLLETSFYDCDVEYLITRLKHEDDRNSLKMKLVFPRYCSFTIRFAEGSVVEIINARRMYESSDFDGNKKQLEEIVLKRVLFNQMNEQGAQLHNVLRVVSNVYRICVQFVDNHSFFAYLIEAYSKFVYPASIWGQPDSFTQYENQREIHVNYKRGLEVVTFSGSSNELTITASKKHCDSEISVSTFGLGEDKSAIIDTLCWYMKLSGIVQQITDDERKSTEHVIDFNTGYHYVEPERTDNIQAGDGL